jgi:hypothetical protein
VIQKKVIKSKQIERVSQNSFFLGKDFLAVETDNRKVYEIFTTSNGVHFCNFDTTKFEFVFKSLTKSRNSSPIGIVDIIGKKFYDINAINLIHCQAQAVHLFKDSTQEWQKCFERSEDDCLVLGFPAPALLMDTLDLFKHSYDRDRLCLQKNLLRYTVIGKKVDVECENEGEISAVENFIHYFSNRDMATQIEAALDWKTTNYLVYDESPLWTAQLSTAREL